MGGKKSIKIKYFENKKPSISEWFFGKVENIYPLVKSNQTPGFSLNKPGLKLRPGGL